MQFVIFDLEWNGSYSRRRKMTINEIIDFGAVKLSEDMQIIDNFSMLVKPQVGKKLNSRIKELTHISNEELELADNTFTHVLKLFSEFARDCVLLSWGTSDIHTLLENCAFFTKTKEITFTDRYVNLQSYCEHCLNAVNPSKQMGLSTAAQLLGIEFEQESLHRAHTDSMLSALCFIKLFDIKKLKPFICKLDSEFYDRLSFKNIIISDINNPLIDKSQLTIYCEKCGRMAKRKSPWVVKNKSFRAKFYCRACNINYEARVRFKLKYDGVVVSRHMRVLQDDEADKATEK